MTGEKIIGLGGVGDCLIIIFKLLERENQNYTYVHLASSEEKAKSKAEVSGILIRSIQKVFLVFPDCGTWKYSESW